MLSWGSYFTHEQKLTVSIAVTFFNAGLLRKDAEMKKDKHILRHKRGRDCVSIEVRYHKSCYPNYTRPIATPEQQSSSADKELLDASFCATIVEQKILQKKVYRMTELHEKYMKMAGSQDPNMRVDKLKTLLKKKFPMLVFHHPARRNESTFVYCESGRSRALENLPPASSSTETDSVEDISAEEASPKKCPDSADLHTLYNASMMLRQAFSSVKTYSGPWPPLASDLDIAAAESMIPVPLYNMSAWSLGFSDEPTLDHFVSVPRDIHLKLVSLLQDSIYLQSKGCKQTPKSLCLGLIVRHLTRSTQLLGLLNHFGHCASYSTVPAFETALAQLQLDQCSPIPAGVAHTKCSFAVYDIIDFSEETRSGAGTTHHTNGILVQRCQNTDDFGFVDRSSIPRRKRSLDKSELTASKPYVKGTRKGTDVDCTAVNIAEQLQGLSRRADTIFSILRYYDDGSNLPGWTGYNTMLHSSDDLIKSRITYLLVIEASH